jgi:hypothetical protein
MMTKFDDDKGELPTGELGYGVIHFKALKGGKGVVIQDCGLGNGKMTNRWIFDEVGFVNDYP